MAAGGIRVGIALSSTQAVGLILGREEPSPVTIPGDLNPDSAELQRELRRVLASLKRALDEGTGRDTHDASVHLALVPPLSDARILPFPPLRRGEVEAVLKRDVGRHFLGASRPQVVGVRIPRRLKEESGTGEVSVPVLAAAASMAFLETLRKVMDEVGWRASSFSPAHSAWLEAASSRRGGAVGAVAAVAGSTAHLIRFKGNDPVSVRKLPSADRFAVAEALQGTEGEVMVLADARTFSTYQGEMASRGLTATGDPRGWPTADVAAAARADSGPPDLVPPFLADQRAKRDRRRITFLLVAAAILVLASLGVHLWGVYRELGEVREARSAIRPEVAPLLAARDSLMSLTTRAESMDSLVSNNPVWTRFLVDLSAVLPRDTYLTGFFASGDTVEVEAAGDRAGEAIQALREAGLFQEVRLQGLVERELENGETAVERFRLWGRVPDLRGEEEGS